MSRMPLAASLALLTAAIVLLVAGALAPAALVLFGRLAERNARARVDLAALGALEGLAREADETATAAGLLAERPTLLGLLAAGDRAGAADFLDRFVITGGLDGGAVFKGDEMIAGVPAQLPWDEIRRRAEPAAGYQPPLPGEQAPLLTASVEIAALHGARVMLIRRLQASVAERLSGQVGLPVSLLAGGAQVAAAAGTAGDTATGYRSRVPVGDGEAVWIEASLPASAVAAEIRPLRRAFVMVTLVASLLALAAGAVAGRRLARPLETMRAAARRIGEGDLATPVTPAPGAEMSALSATLEEMRLHLRALTAELRHRESEARALLAGIVEGVFAVDDERRIQYLNPQAADLLGVDAGAATGRFCGDVLRPESAPGERPCENDCPIVHARSRGSSRAVEHLHLAAGRRTVVITSAPPSGSRQVQVLRDETESEAARRSRDAVLAHVSHELKTPLSAQLASIELLRDGLGSLDPEASLSLVTAMERSTLRLMRLVDNLLESVRIETGQAGLRRVPVELESVLAEADALTRPLLEQRRQRLEVEGVAGLPALTGDPAQLTQVLVNLLANAHKYAPEGSTIRVGGALAHGAVSLWVEDAGPGISPALSASIFDRFSRGQEGGEGMGLGLWIAKSIVARHGGRIAVSSSPQGGARFTLTFPVAEAA